MTIKRRTLVKALATGGGLLGLCALVPQWAMAAWMREAFAAGETNAAIKALYGGDLPVESAEVMLDAPDIAENGAVVPLTISTTLPNVETVSVFIAENPSPLAAQFIIPEGTLAEVSTRVRMGQTTHVTAVIQSDGKLYSATKEVKVTIGGCGG
ncbi:thiosulfate oxidation carrier protein SoxY [Marinobacterium sediminicola]|uniref:Thiosulfate-binding protein SoxY n=1 Tax=Marinobacterium sediminicola TaxID=518898 RepID=A0ABY1RYW2_9GAMM|nr:thiosulfate oxidation carrier protein SoxY [Marinobacterium sediminicola]ULG67989.1 thiosulfate oxidation carrier protein SoxY [Marinobacterium sediminicola]SMR73502.1 thiosulfate-binding protein SoxY [Marinobacterium sediminicola]